MAVEHKPTAITDSENSYSSVQNSQEVDLDSIYAEDPAKLKKIQTYRVVYLAREQGTFDERKFNKIVQEMGVDFIYIPRQELGGQSIYGIVQDETAKKLAEHAEEKKKQVHTKAFRKPGSKPRSADDDFWGGDW